MSLKEFALETVKNTSIAHYGERAEAKELAARLMMLHPKAEEIGVKGMLEAATIAMVYGASPFPSMNELHVYKDNHGVHAVLGINYWQRRANAVGHMMIEQPRPMNEEERNYYGVADNQLGAICKAIKHDALKDINNMVTLLGMSQKEAREATAIIGIGIVGKSERAANGRPLIDKAMKRASMGLFRKLAPFVPGEQFQAGAGLAQAADGRYIPDNSREWGSLRDAPEVEPMELEALNDALYGDEPEEAVIIEPAPEPQPLSVSNFLAVAVERIPVFNTPFQVMGVINKARIVIEKAHPSQLGIIMGKLESYAHMLADGTNKAEAFERVFVVNDVIDEEE